MDNFQTGLFLFSIGMIGHLIMRRSINIRNSFLSMIGNERGEGDGGDGGVKFTPEQQKHIDGLIAAKAADYHNKLTPLQKQLDELSKFKTEHEKSLEQKNQKELEDAKKYDEAKKGYETKINELSGKLNESQLAIQDRDIRYELLNEINRQNGFAEETLAMIRGNASIDANGKVVIKTKDQNGVEVQVSVAEGIQKFLTERPHLVKSNHKPGGGAGSGAGDGGGAGAGGAGNGQGETLESLNAQLAKAMRGTDLKLRSELRGKISKLMAAKGIATR